MMRRLLGSKIRVGVPFIRVVHSRYASKYQHRYEYLESFPKKTPNGGALCGVIEYNTGNTLDSVLNRLKDAYDGRSVHVTDPETSKIDTTHPSGVFVLTGESGSGKTHAALSCNPRGVTILLQYATDIPNLEHVIPNKQYLAFVSDVVATCMAVLPPFKHLADIVEDVRLHIVIDDLGHQPNRLRLAVQAGAGIFMALRKEMGWYEIKLFCLGSGVALSPVEHRRDYFKLCALGASSSAKNMVECGDNVLVQLLREIRHFTYLLIRGTQREKFEKKAVQEFGEHYLIKPLLDNRRAAAILATYVNRVLNDLPEDSNTQRATLMVSTQDALSYVSERLKSLGSLSSLTHDEAMKLCAIALRQTLCGSPLRNVFQQYPSKRWDSLERDDADQKLLCDYAIMSERVDEILAVERVVRSRDITIFDRLEQSSLRNAVAAEREMLHLPRFVISRALATMMLTNFGLNTVPIVSSQNSDLALAMAMKFLLILRSFRRSETVLASINSASKACAQPNKRKKTSDSVSLPSIAPALLVALEKRRHLSSETVSFPNELNGVHLRYLEQPLSATSVKNGTFKKGKGNKKLNHSVQLNAPFCLETLVDIHDAVRKEGKAVVMVNKTRTLYADVVVVAAGLVCLVQCKQALVGYDVPSEVYKMMDMQYNVEITECLCRIAGLARSDVVVLFAQATDQVAAVKSDECLNDDGVKESVQDFYAKVGYPCHVRVSKPSTVPHEDILFPLGWPSTTSQQFASFEFKAIGR